MLMNNESEREALTNLIGETAFTKKHDARGNFTGYSSFADIADVILAAGFRRQGPVTDEWEYGIRPEDDDVPLGVSPMPSFDAAWTRASNIYGGWVIVRRRKAGQWEPVEATGEAP
jgi:hypothetical protein